MNLDELRTVQSKERRKDSLQHLRDSFYGDVAGYIADLKAERSAAAEEADDPFSSPEVSRLTDEIETAEEVVEAVYERRVGKVVKLASFAAADMPVDEDGMTAEEKALFEDLVTRIGKNKENVLAILAGKRDPADVSSDTESTTTAADMVAPDGSRPEADDVGRATETPEADSATGGVLADAMGGDTAPDDAEADAVQSAAEDGSDSTASHTPVDPEPAPPGAVSESPDTEPDSSADTADATETTDGSTVAADDARDDTERTTVRITKDVGEIFGVDEREYDLATDDVVMLPTTNAEPLIEREAAEKLD
jgi:DNA replication factor GINS